MSLRSGSTLLRCGFRKRHVISAALCALMLMSASASAQGRWEISPQAVEAHVRFLADDLLEGRNDGTAGHEIAARYVAAQFAAFGLNPGFGGRWFQQVPLRERQIAGGGYPSLTIGERRFDPVSAIILPNVDPVISGEPIFLGYGIQNNALGIDDTKGRELKGRIAVIFDGVPANVPEKFARGKAARLASRGVKAVLILPTGDGARGEIFRAAAGMHPSGAQQSEAAIVNLTTEAATALFDGSPYTFADLRARASRGEDLRGISISAKVTLDAGVVDRDYESPNVLGVIPGRDPQLAREVVVVTAHLDHLGKKNEFPGEDKIFNGAMDNASGVAAMIEIARAVMDGQRPKRTVLFAAVTAEEDGLRGSDWLASNFPGGLSAAVAVINLDMPILRYDFVDVTAFGGDESTIGLAVERSASRMNLKVRPDPLPEENFLRRSDHYSFVRRGVPSVFLMTGFGNGGEKAFRNFLSKDYHHPNDDLGYPMNWAAGAKFASLNMRIVMDIANSRARPLWYIDSEIAKEFATTKAKSNKHRRAVTQ